MENTPFTLTLKISHYNWTVKVFEPFLTELGSFDTEVNKLHSIPIPKDADFEPLRAIFVKLIQSWDCVDRQGLILPFTLEGMRQIPPSVLLTMAIELPKSLQAGFSDPKVNSPLSPTTAQEPETPKESTQSPLTP